MIKKFTLLLLAMLSIAGTAKATEIWTGSCAIGAWTDSNVTVEKAAFASATAGNIIKVTFSAYAETESDGITPVTYWQYNLGKEQDGWKALTDFSGGDLTKGQKSASYTLTSTNVKELQDYGLAVNGRYITVSKVELLTVEGTVNLFTGSITAGNWENNVTWSSDGDKAKLAAVQKNDYIRMTYTLTASGAQAAIQISWSSVVGVDDNTYSSEDGANNTRTLTLTIDDATILEKIQQNDIQVRGKNITITAVDQIKPDNRYDAVPVTIGSDGIATWSSSKNADFSGVSGVTPYYASEVSKGQVTLTSVESTRAYVGYIVKGSEGTYSIPVADSTPDWITAFSNLTGTGDNAGKVYKSVYSGYTKQESWETDAQVTNIKTKYRYIFAKHGDNIGFYMLDTGYSEGDNPYHTLAAHKAYLETDSDVSGTAVGARGFIRLSFGGGEGTTAINTALKNPIVEDGIYYTLQGVAVKNPSKGIYILNGKKVFVK